MNILYIYDEPNWAIHNVGRYWAKILEPDYQFTFVQHDEKEKYDPGDFDYVLWGYTTIGLRVRRLKRLLQVLSPRYSNVWLSNHNGNFVSVLHDPSEIFPQHENWRMMRPRLHHLKRYARLAVCSNEMKSIMKELEYDCPQINTNSTLELRDAKAIKEEPLRIFTKTTNKRRKNLTLFRQLQGAYRKDVDKFDDLVGLNILPEPDYIRLIDGYNCYVCTSWQEGGPLPLMDAMRRGCAVLTTPVGQTDELVRDGFNGFICNTYEEFAERVELLGKESNLLFAMRLNSLRISAGRTEEQVRPQLIDFLARAETDDCH